MKKIIIYMFIVLYASIVNNTFGQLFNQVDKEQSKTKSALITAQSETFKMVFDSVYNAPGRVDVDKMYKNAITKKTAECLANDIRLWGIWVIANVENGKFKRYRLSFEKPEDNGFKVPEKAKRKYKKAFKKAKKDFIKTRKKKDLDEILGDKYLKRYLGKCNKSFIKQKNKHLRKLAK